MEVRQRGQIQKTIPALLIQMVLLGSAFILAGKILMQRLRLLVQYQTRTAHNMVNT